MPPPELIPLAEETGVIAPVGQWVLEDAYRQARAWQDPCPADPPWVVSVNLSARQIEHALDGPMRRATQRGGATIAAYGRIGVTISIRSLEELHWTCLRCALLGFGHRQHRAPGAFSPISSVQTGPVGLESGRGFHTPAYQLFFTVTTVRIQGWMKHWNL
jgi:hypothetical protein